MKLILTKNLIFALTTLISVFYLNSNQYFVLSNTVNNQEASTSSVQYRCQDRNGNPSTIAYTHRGAIELIIWQNDYFSASGYTSQRRCQEVTDRFQQHYEAKNLRYISTGKLNNYNVICVAEKSGDCKSNGLLITLEPQDNPEQVLQDVFNLAARRSNGGVTRAGGRGSSIKQMIDLDRFLAEIPVIDDEVTGNEENLDNETDSTANQISESETTNSSNGDRMVIENPFDSF